MVRKTRVWLGLGTAVLVAGGAAPGAPLSSLPDPGLSGALPPDGDAGASAPVRLAQAEEGGFEGGEGGEGEGGEGGGQILGTITEFRLSSTDPSSFRYNASRQVATYAALVHETYAAAHAAAVGMQEAIGALLDAPSTETLAAARAAWIEARAAYMPTEAFLFYAGPVDGEGGPVKRLNAWPLNEAFIDYVEGQPHSGFINDPSVPITRASIVGMDQTANPYNVTTGWHAIEFLLWGEDRAADGSGARPYTDYSGGQGNSDRRREYLAIVTQLLVNDLRSLVAQWAPGANNYRAAVLAMDQRNAIGRAFNGMAVLAGYEVGLKRIGAGLRRGFGYEQSRYSDNSAADNVNDVRGIANVYFGRAAGADGAGFDALLAGIDPALNDRVVAAIARAQAAVAALDEPFDSVIASPRGSAARAEGEEALAALKDLADALRAAGNRLGVLVVVPGV
jgi:putative iron-regulated protein